MQVEVSVQDCFYTAFQSATADAEELNGLIPAETWEIWFEQWLETLSPDLPPADAYELSLRLTNDAEIQALNAQYRHQNQPTDVLAFAALEVDCPQPPIEFLASLPLYLGDIVISVDTAYRQAQQQGHSLQTELAWLAAHGLLHLLGWDHPDEASLTQMLNQQETLLMMFGLNI
ncbi:MAG: rRNA maturation RNase YbeY [Aphanothece sp. CMT-3BRIN-NPC111]|nr:rRNA maturation RNase YbeY [Aphanothece sp. CMT-3BRIN-NPC111]